MASLKCKFDQIAFLLKQLHSVELEYLKKKNLQSHTMLALPKACLLYLGFMIVPLSLPVRTLYVLFSLIVMLISFLCSPY